MCLATGICRASFLSRFYSFLLNELVKMNLSAQHFKYPDNMDTLTHPRCWQNFGIFSNSVSCDWFLKIAFVTNDQRRYTYKTRNRYLTACVQTNQIVMWHLSNTKCFGSNINSQGWCTETPEYVLFSSANFQNISRAISFFVLQDNAMLMFSHLN